MIKKSTYNENKGSCLISAQTSTFLCALLILCLSLMSCDPRGSSMASMEERETMRPNILFIAIDDLRPDLGCYGDSITISPNIDRLATNGLVFNRAYCQQAVCSPSRTSLLTGMRPDSTKVWDLETHFRSTIPTVVTLPQYFKQQGYYTTWWGKLFHASLLDSVSWTHQGERLEPDNNWRAYVTEAAKREAARNNGGGPPYEIAEVADNAYPDGQVADNAIATLEKIKKDVKKPFFLALGFYKPHLPFNAPKKYWDMYNPEDFKIPSMDTAPKNAPPIALTDWWELRAYSGVPQQGKVSDDMALKLIHGYHACISYTDAQVGRVLKKLKDLGLDKNTIVVLWGDHGWKLGEYGDWCKHTNFEIDTRSPLIIKDPRMASKGQNTMALVEFIDIYPTLCDLAGLEIPDRQEGSSLLQILRNPKLPGKKMVVSQYPKQKNEIMGYSYRTDRYRYTKWLQNDGSNKVLELELYDLQKDPASTINVSEDPDYTETIETLNSMATNLTIKAKDNE